MNVLAGKSSEDKTQAQKAASDKNGKEAVSLLDNRLNSVAQAKLVKAADQNTGKPQDSTPHYLVDNRPQQKKANNTGLPDNLKTGIENLSGHTLDDVKVHYNSSAPAQLQALAYAQGSQIHIAPGHEKHLPHEAWHVVQQKQGRVKPTMQLKGKINVNDDTGLEHEADVMGQKAMQMVSATPTLTTEPTKTLNPVNIVQRLTGFEAETNIPIYDATNDGFAYVNPAHTENWHPSIGYFLFGGLTYGLTYGYDREAHFSISADHNSLQRAHRKVFNLLLMHGLLVPGAKYRSMSNMEYISAPRDEMAPEFDDLFKEDTDLVHAHIEQSLGIARSDTPKNIPMSAGILSGIPISDMVAWIGASGANVDIFEGALIDMREMINDKLYLQQTTGVLPSQIPAMYANAAGQMKEAGGGDGQIMAEVMELSNHIGEAAFNAANISDIDFLQHKSAVVGFLVYLATHLIVDSLSLTDFLTDTTTTKNLFPYLPKVPLSVAFTALPPSVRKTDVWTVLNNRLFIAATGIDSNYWGGKYKLKIKDRGFIAMSEVFKEYPRETETELGLASYDEAPDRPEAKKTLEKLAKGDRVNTGVEKNFDNLDQPNRGIKTEQKAIPVEDRFFSAKFGETITKDNFGAALRGKIAESQSRYSKDIDPSVHQVKPPKPDKDDASQKRITEKAGWIEEQFVIIQEELKENAKTIIACEEAIPPNIITIRQIAAEREQYREAYAILQPAEAEYTQARNKIKVQLEEVQSGEKEQAELDKLEDYQAYKEKLRIYKALIDSNKLGALSVVKKKIVAYDSQIKGLEAKNENYKQHIIAVTKNQKKVDVMLQGLQKMKENPISDEVELEAQENEIDKRVFSIRGAQNSIFNTLGVNDKSLNKDAVFEDFKKLNQLPDFKQYIAYRKTINPENFKVGANRENIIALLSPTEGLEARIIELEIQLKANFGSPQISKLIVQYLAIAKEYNRLVIDILRLEKKDKADKQHSGASTSLETV